MLARLPVYLAKRVDELRPGIGDLRTSATPHSAIAFRQKQPSRGLRRMRTITTAQGPRLIDWLDAARARAPYEIAQCHVLLAEIGPKHAEDPERAAVNSVLQGSMGKR